MNTSIYKLTSAKIAGGAIYVRYRAGLLRNIDIADATPTPDQLGYLLRVLPAQEAGLATAALGSMKIEEVPERSAKDKLVLFITAYQEYRKVAYAATQTERSNIRTVPVSRELLTVFFESPLLDFSINNYIKRINQTRDMLKNGRDITKRFPTGYDADFYAKCDGPTLIEYKRHLRELGWKYTNERGWTLPDRV